MAWRLSIDMAAKFGADHICPMDGINSLETLQNLLTLNMTENITLS